MIGREAAMQEGFEPTGERILITGAAGGIGAMTAPRALRSTRPCCWSSAPGRSAGARAGRRGAL
jgi:NAD(P)-dependent dehydrogenase (short-subunit alcohol dehydrogenase family)